MARRRTTQAPKLATVLTQRAKAAGGAKRLARKARTDPAAAKQLASAQLLRKERARWALLPDTTTTFPEQDRWRIKSASHIPGGVSVIVEMLAVPKRKDRTTGARLPAEGPYPVKTLFGCADWIRAAYSGERHHGFEMVEHQGHNTIEVRALQSDPFVVRYGADMLHPNLQLPAPHIPKPGALHDAIVIGRTATGSAVGLPVRPGGNVFFWGLTRGGKSTTVRLALPALLVRDNLSISVCNLEAGANGISDYAHADAALDGYCADLGHTSAFLWAWIDRLKALPPDLDNDGSPLPKITSRHSLMIIDGVKKLDVSGWQALTWICNEAGKFGGSGWFLGQLATKGDIPKEAQSITRTAATTVMVGRCNDRTLYSMAFDTQPNEVDLAHHSGPGRATVMTADGERHRARLYNEACPTNGDTYPADVALAHLSAISQRSVSDHSATISPITERSIQRSMAAEIGSPPGTGALTGLTARQSQIVDRLKASPCTQVELMRELGIKSRTTVRETVRPLIDLGVIEAETTGNTTTLRMAS